MRFPAPVFPRRLLNYTILSSERANKEFVIDSASVIENGLSGWLSWKTQDTRQTR